MLPDLCEQGYSIQRQVLIGGISRRLDIVLERPQDAWIIELKRGSPSVSDVVAQIHDYERCWKAAYPDKPVKLMVIATVDSDLKAKQLAEQRVEYRSISPKRILEAISEGVDTDLLGECNRLQINDEDRIRFLLSNFSHTTVPDGMRFGAPWSHESVFYALIRDGHKHKKPWFKNIYVTLFNQNPNCAVLYHPETSYADGAPLHVNPRAKSWPADGWCLQKLIDAEVVKWKSLDNKGPGKESLNFDKYHVNDWDRFAEIIGLKP